MPKAKIPDPNRPDTRRMIPARRKMKIGGRKSIRSALQMSNEELRKVLTESGRTKDKVTATKELERRGAALVLEEKSEEQVAV